MSRSKRGNENVMCKYNKTIFGGINCPLLAVRKNTFIAEVKVTITINYCHIFDKVYYFSRSTVIIDYIIG